MERQCSAMHARQLTARFVERSLAFLDRLAGDREKHVTPLHLQVGIAGEDAALFFLMRTGYTVAGRRWSSGMVAGDIDLIAWKEDLLCIVEVKTRTAHTITPAEAAVDEHKRQILRRLARAYVRQLARAEAPQVRFDVVSVYLVPGLKAECIHFENAFGWTRRYDD